MKKNCYEVPPLIREILEEGRHYGDGDPRWREGKNDRPCQSAQQAEAERLRVIKRLERHARQNPDEGVTALIDRLYGCDSQDRCGSGACPECARATQRWFVGETQTLIDGGPATILTPIAACMKTTDISTGNPTAPLKVMCGRAMDKSGIEVAAVGIDFSYNYDREGAAEPHFMPHPWVLVPREMTRKQLRLFFDEFPTALGVPRSRRHAAFDGDLRALAYGLKPNFRARESYVQEKSPERGGRTCRNTRGRPIRADQAVALMLMLDRIGLGQRILLRGARMTRTRDGVVIRRLGAP